MPRVAQTLDNQPDQSFHYPAPSGASKMYSSPKSQTFTPPGLSCSTPQSGTFTAARTKSKFDSDQNKNKENQVRSKLNFKGALLSRTRPGSLAEAAVSEQSKCQDGGRGQISGGGGGAVRPGQLQDWEKKNTSTFYGPSSSSNLGWNKQISVNQKTKKSNANDTRKELEDKINRVSMKNPPSSGSGAGDYHFDLKFPNPADPLVSPGKVLETIDLSNYSPNTPPAPLLPQQVLLPHLIGFKNYGNTCYLNASLQSLLGLQMVVTDVLNTKHMIDLDVSGQGLMRAFSQLCMAYIKGDGVWANQEMKEVKKVMEILDKQFLGNKMQDASEFLSRFIDELNEDLKNFTKGNEPKEADDVMTDIVHENSQMVVDNFLHEKEELFTCCGCEAETRCMNRDMSMWCDTVSSIHLNRTRSMSMQQLLEQSLAQEVRERRCEACGFESATTTSKLVKLPKVLIIILKRYRYNNQDLTSSGKVSRQVEIPETVCLTSLVSDTVRLPSTSLPVLVPHQTQDVAVPLPTTPVKLVLPLPTLETPAKFKGLTDEQMVSLSEEDQLEYMLHISEKEALGNEKPVGDDEDEDLKAALEASMRDETFNEILTLAGEPEPWMEASEANSFNQVGSDKCRTPARKRSFGQLVGGVVPHGDGGDIRSDLKGQGTEFENAINHFDYEVKPTSGIRLEHRKTYSKVVRGKDDSDLSQRDSLGAAVPRPTTKEEEEDDLKRALELSTQESKRSLLGDNFGSQMEWDDTDDTENNNNMEEVASPTPGKPEHSYQLHSVVSHYGASASAGHYVADVYRFDGGGWHRYDDTRVTKTDGRTVRTGPNCANGYILTYLYQPLWEECKSSAVQRKDVAQASV